MLVGNLHHVEVHQAGVFVLVLLRQVQKPVVPSHDVINIAGPSLLVEGNGGEVGIDGDIMECWFWYSLILSFFLHSQTINDICITDFWAFLWFHPDYYMCCPVTWRYRLDSSPIG